MERLKKLYRLAKTHFERYKNINQKAKITYPFTKMMGSREKGSGLTLYPFFGKGLREGREKD